MRQIDDFVSRLGAKIDLDKNLVVKRQNRYFVLSKNLKRLISRDFFCAGVYLGKTKGGRFFPSFNLLRMVAEEKSNRIVIDKKTEWLFICGRDVFKQGIIEVRGSKRKGDHTLILNRHGECLGFGRIVCNLDREREGVVIKNISDIGDFLRREKHQA
jgi:ribosome biogenesis protein Nip4